MAFTVKKAPAVLLVAACIASAALVAPPAAAQGNPAQAVASAYNASGLDLFKQFAAKPGNIVFSPYSIGTAMAMALAGARGQTEREMLTALRHTLKREEIEAANGGIIATLNSYDRSAATPTCPRGATLKGTQCECPSPPNPHERCFGGAAIMPPSAQLLTANALMLTKHGNTISKDYIALLQSKFGAELFQNADLAQINGWANRKTEGKIDKILEKLDPESVGVLLNAVYFKARWGGPFEKYFTRNEGFNISAAQKVQVPTMHRTGRYALVTQPGYRALRLPYSIPSIAMVIVLPNSIDGATELSCRIDAKEIADTFAELRFNEKLVELALPRFKTEYRATLVDTFKNAGMKLAFDDKRADFGGVTGRPVPPVELYISQIVHRAVIDVSEESTEAAAVTAIEFARPTSAPVRPATPEPFRVDRPFLFYIVDDATGAVLFQGRISDPRQTVVAAR